MYAVRSQNVLSDVMRLFLYAWTGRSGGEEDGRRIVQFAVAYTTVSPGGDGTASSGASDGGVSVVTRHTRVLTCARRLATEAADLYRDADPVAVLYLLWHQVGLVGARVPATAVVVTALCFGMVNGVSRVCISWSEAASTMERGVVQLVVALLWPLVLPKLLELRVRPLKRCNL